ADAPPLASAQPGGKTPRPRRTARPPPRGPTPLRRQHGEELEPPHRAFLRGSGSRINYSRSGLRTAAKAARSCPLWLLSNVRFTLRVQLVTATLLVVYRRRASRVPPVGRQRRRPQAC